MIVQLQEATQYYYYRAVLAIFPLTPDQIRAYHRTTVDFDTACLQRNNTETE